MASGVDLDVQLRSPPRERHLRQARAVPELPEVPLAEKVLPAVATEQDPRSARTRYDAARGDPTAGGSDDLENRVELLEREVARLRERAALTGGDAAAARTLASGADRDVSEVRAELRAHTMALNALRETQIEQGHRIDSLRDVQIEQGQRIADGFANVHQGMQEIVRLLGRDDGSG